MQPQEIIFVLKFFAERDDTKYKVRSASLQTVFGSFNGSKQIGASQEPYKRRRDELVPTARASKMCVHLLAENLGN